MKSAFKKRESRSGYFFTLPTLIIVFSLIIYPLGYALFISTQKTNLVNEWEFVGARYYAELLTDADFISSLKISFTFAFFVVAGNFIVGLLLAVILNQKLKFATVFKIILMLPWLLPEVVVALPVTVVLNTGVRYFTSSIFVSLLIMLVSAESTSRINFE